MSSVKRSPPDIVNIPNGNLSNQLNLQDLQQDLPEIKRKLEEAIDIIWEESFPKLTLWQALLTVLHYCGDFEVQYNVVESLLKEHDVQEYKQWFCPVWFKDMPRSMHAFLALNKPNYVDIGYFLCQFNLEKGTNFVFTIPCRFVNWAQSVLPGSKMGSSMLHLNLGSKRISISGLKEIPSSKNVNGWFVLNGSEVSKVKFFRSQSVPGEIQYLYFETSMEENLFLYPDPILSPQKRCIVHNLIKQICDVSVEFIAVEENGQQSILPTPDSDFPVVLQKRTENDLSAIRDHPRQFSEVNKTDINENQPMNISTLNEETSSKDKSPALEITIQEHPRDSPFNSEENIKEKIRNGNSLARTAYRRGKRRGRISCRGGKNLQRKNAIAEQPDEDIVNVVQGCSSSLSTIQEKSIPCEPEMSCMTDKVDPESNVDVKNMRLSPKAIEESGNDNLVEEPMILTDNDSSDSICLSDTNKHRRSSEVPSVH